MTNCVFSSTCNGFKLGTDSMGGSQNVTISNCTVYDTRLAGIALELVDGGLLENVNVSNIVMHNVARLSSGPFGYRARHLPGTEKPGVGILRNVVINNIQATGVGDRSPECVADRAVTYPWPIFPWTGLAVVGLPGHPVENITLSNIRLRFAGGTKLTDVPREIPEKAETYPDFQMFGVLPAYGFYACNAKNVRLHSLDLSFERGATCDRHWRWTMSRVRTSSI